MLSDSQRLFLPYLRQNLLPIFDKDKGKLKKLRSRKEESVKKGEEGIGEEAKDQKLSKHLEVLIRNYKDSKIDRRILKDLINFEENDAREMMIMVRNIKSKN